MAEIEYIAPETYGSTWSSAIVEPITNQINFGLGQSNVQKMVGEYTLHGPHATARLTLGLIRGIVNPNPPSGSPVFSALYCDVSVGYGSAAYQFSMDWAHGASIVIPAGKATVYARQIGQIDYKIQLSAGLSIMPTGSRIAPTFTAYFNVPAKPGARIIDIPNRARGLIVPKVFSGAPSDFEVTILRGDSIATDVIGFYSHQIAADSAIWTSGVQMAGAANKVQIQSALGLLADNANAIFLLDG
jgi:hypothetical protein